LFSTYSTLVSQVTSSNGKKKGNGGSRIDQIVDWCGGASFEGCLVFDECHRAKNFKPMHEGEDTGSGSRSGICAVQLQRLLPKARVVYCSATGISDIQNMAFMERLGLWGPRTAFENFGVFAATIKKRGVGAFELLAMEMKAKGAYVSRGLSYATCEFSTIKVVHALQYVWNYLSI
jgi:hypothetical protein